MGPAHLWRHKVLKEEGRCDGATRAGASVLHIGQAALEAFAVGGAQGHAPEVFTALGSGFDQALGQGIVG